MSAFDVLKEILTDGLLRPSFALRQRQTVGDIQRTIQGPAQAVCFTEQTLNEFAKSCEILPDRYSGYGIALHKWQLFNYGGRPVIYGDETIRDRLDDRDKYLLVRYQPIPHPTFRYPVDWMHEREWRVVPKPCTFSGIGDWPNDKVHFCCLLCLLLTSSWNTTQQSLSLSILKLKNYGHGLHHCPNYRRITRFSVTSERICIPLE